jgi:phosphatidylglycerol:prolipoprotein diacylglycerol transferase
LHPVLVELGKLRIYSYGFMLALSFMAGIILAGVRARRRGVPPAVVYDLSILLIISAIVGSRGLYIITHLDHYHGIIDIFALWQGGATYYGGMFLAVVAALVFLRVKKLSFLKIADICSPSIGLGIFFTRIGCFLSGCCFGIPTSSFLGVVFPAGSPAAFQFPEQAIHPTQLYSSAYGALIFILLMLIDRKELPEGSLFGFLCVFYGIARFVIDFFRYYEGSAMIGQLTFNQLLSIGLIITGSVLIAVRVFGRKGRRPDESIGGGQP